WPRRVRCAPFVRLRSTIEPAIPRAAPTAEPARLDVCCRQHQRGARDIARGHVQRGERLERRSDDAQRIRRQEGPRRPVVTAPRSTQGRHRRQQTRRTTMSYDYERDTRSSALDPLREATDAAVGSLRYAK